MFTNHKAHPVYCSSGLETIPEWQNKQQNRRPQNNVLLSTLPVRHRNHNRQRDPFSGSVLAYLFLPFAGDRRNEIRGGVTRPVSDWLHVPFCGTGR